MDSCHRQIKKIVVDGRIYNVFAVFRPFYVDNEEAVPNFVGLVH